MTGINFLFLLAIVGIVAATSIPFTILLVFGIKKKRQWMIWIGGVPTIGILLISLSLFCMLIYGFIRPWSDTTDPSEIRSSFNSNFSFDPDKDFIPLNRRIYCPSDFGCMHLKFRASVETVEKIKKLEFKKVPINEFLNATSGKNTPDWWVKPENSITDCYYNPEWKGSFSSNSAYLCYIKGSSEIYFYSEGID